MCRWLAYAGPAVAMDGLLFRATNSLIRQSLSARHSIVPTNGDGFGLGWYGELRHPGLFRDTMPAWNDLNLRSLAEQIKSKLFFAHVRAATGTPTTRLNCHPFRHDKWLFMHNGQVGGYAQVRRDLERLIPDHLYESRLGCTDSELLFLLLLANDLENDAPAAFRKTFSQVEEIMAARGVADPLRITAAVSNGNTMYAARYSSDQKSPTLFYVQGDEIKVKDCGDMQFRPGDGAVLVLSEPLDEVSQCWNAVPEGCLLTIRDGKVSVEKLVCRAAQAVAAE